MKQARRASRARERPAPAEAGSSRLPILAAGFVLVLGAAIWAGREPVELALARRDGGPGLTRFMASHPDSLPAALELAEIHLREGRASAAVEGLTPLVDRYPGWVRGRTLLGRGLLEDGKPGPAYAHLQIAVNLTTGQDPEALWWLGQVMERNGDEDGARSRYEEGARLKGAPAALLARLGQLAQEDAQYTDAAEAFRKATEADPRNVDAWTALADLRLRLGDVAGAVVAARRALQLAPDHPQALFRLALALEATGDPIHDAEIDASFQRAVELSPEKWVPRWRYAQRLRRTHRNPEALELLETNLRENPLHLASLAELSIGARIAGRKDRAAWALRRLGKLSQLENQSAELETKVWLEPENHAARLKLARFFLENGRPDLAKGEVDRVLRRVPWNAEGRKLSARIAAQPGPSL